LHLEIRYKPPHKGHKYYDMTICVYCSSSDDIAEVYKEATGELGTLLGGRKTHVVNGAGSIGLMRILSDAVLVSGGTVTGIIPDFMVDKGWCHQGLTNLVRTTDMHERKQTMASMSDAAIALPGGYGTLEELLEIITWRQLGLYSKPVIILNINGFFDPLIDMFRRIEAEHFLRHPHSDLWRLAGTPQEAIEKLKTP